MRGGASRERECYTWKRNEWRDGQTDSLISHQLSSSSKILNSSPTPTSKSTHTRQDSTHSLSNLEFPLPSFDFEARFHLLQLLSQTLCVLLATRASAPDNPADPFVTAIFLVSFFFDSLKVCEIPNTPTPTPRSISLSLLCDLISDGTSQGCQYQRWVFRFRSSEPVAFALFSGQSAFLVGSSIAVVHSSAITTSKFGHHRCWG